jgi:hypothetical protein
MGNVYFHLYKLENAINITLSGQHLIRYLAENFNNFFKNEFWKDKRFFSEIDPANAVMQPVVKIIETDSVAKGSIINVRGHDMKIEDLFNICTETFWIGENKYGSFKTSDVKPYTDSLNIKTKELEQKEITYVMEHTVEKEMFEIEYDNNTLIVTEDHSIFVERNNNIIEVKPKEILETDLIITI